MALPAANRTNLALAAAGAVFVATAVAVEHTSLGGGPFGVVFTVLASAYGALLAHRGCGRLRSAGAPPSRYAETATELAIIGAVMTVGMHTSPNGITPAVVAFMASAVLTVLAGAAAAAHRARAADAREKV